MMGTKTSQEQEATTPAEQRPVVSLEKLSQVMAQIADAVLVADRDGIIEYVNPAFERLSGYSAQEAIGKTPKFLQSDQHSSEFYKSLWQTISSGHVFRALMINRRKGGMLYYEEKTITPLKNEQGEITHYVSTGKDVGERYEARKRLQKMAFTDSLTGLPNRDALLDELQREIEMASRSEVGVGVLFMDLDRFKHVNDSMGHEIGDRLLQKVAKRLLSDVRSGDLIARFGGDEFVIVLTNVKAGTDVASAAEKVLKRLRMVFKIEGREYSINASVGIALYPGDGDDAHDLLRAADLAMYHSKSQRGSNYQFYASDMSEKIREREHLESKIIKAVKSSEFVNYYQPQLDMHDDRIVGAEALLRWHEPHNGVISPDVFIPVAEDTGMIIKLGMQALQQACHRLKYWIGQGKTDFHVAVNLSPIQLLHSGFVSKVAGLLADMGVPASQLTFELTETALAQHLDEAITILSDLSELGIRLAIDDFGTGYSCFCHLRHFPFNELKIDRSFIKDLPGDQTAAAIIGGIIDMAHKMNLTVVAEGVETQEQLDFLRNQGCDRVQGFLISRPVPAAELAWLEKE
ncbi:MAG: EAL domain-containing protein [Chromatiales bacterium]